jgi:hypothetical protein
MSEHFIDVKGYEGTYQVSMTGAVRSIDRTVKSRHGFRKRKGQALKPILLHGYLKVFLKKRLTFIHRIVAENFLIKPSGENIVVNHINGNKTDNHISNLEWCTQSQNVKHAFDTGLAKRGLCGQNKKLDEMQVLTILTLKHLPQRKLAKHFGVTQSIVRYIQIGKTYKAFTKDIL